MAKAHGHNPDDVKWQRHRARRRKNLEVRYDFDLLGGLVRDLMKHRPVWEGTPYDLWVILSDMVRTDGSGRLNDHRFPWKPHALLHELPPDRPFAPGIEVEVDETPPFDIRITNKHPVVLDMGETAMADAGENEE